MKEIVFSRQDAKTAKVFLASFASLRESCLEFNSIVLMLVQCAALIDTLRKSNLNHEIDEHSFYFFVFFVTFVVNLYDASNSSSSASFKTGIPSDLAFLSFDPAASPATT